jgi:ribosome-binding protein aMBF1 (putative translation factor)
MRSDGSVLLLTNPAQAETLASLWPALKADLDRVGATLRDEAGFVNKRRPSVPGRKLTEGAVVAIRARRESGWSVAALARHYEVSGQMIRNILRGLSWADVP